ncbi:MULTISPECIES: hypothetical protein [unclassified Microcoleus]|uniref:hypothetical protein n=1 Tax=unclassified Microcoleus TaxID=2642155 RepID=UPI002FCEAC7F
MTITVEQIKSIIAGAEETLRLLLNQPEYHEIASSENFVTQNELGLADAIQALSEVYQAIQVSECDSVNAVVSSELPPSGISH